MEFLFTLSFYPESFDLFAKAGLLTYSLSGQPSHPAPAGQWHEVDRKDSNELTAAGTVRDSHPVPYYALAPGREQHAP